MVEELKDRQRKGKNRSKIEKEKIRIIIRIASYQIIIFVYYVLL